MHVQTDLQDMFSYSLIPTLITLIIIAIILIIYIIYTNKKKKVIVPIIKPIAKDVNKIKLKYLKEINDLLTKVKNNNITNRKAYQALSIIIRKFVYEMTSIRVQVCTLKDIEMLNIPILYELVSEYYHPEFAEISSGNIISSIEKTKGVIERWN